MGTTVAFTDGAGRDGNIKPSPGEGQSPAPTDATAGTGHQSDSSLGNIGHRSLSSTFHIPAIGWPPPTSALRTQDVWVRVLKFRIRAAVILAQRAHPLACRYTAWRSIHAVAGESGGMRSTSDGIVPSSPYSGPDRNQLLDPLVRG